MEDLVQCDQIYFELQPISDRVLPIYTIFDVFQLNDLVDLSKRIPKKDENIFTKIFHVFLQRKNIFFFLRNNLRVYVT